MLSDPNGEFYSSNYSTSFKRFFIPDANSQGVSDSIFIGGGEPVNSLKVFVLMSHSYTNDITMSLTSPSGTTINLLANKGGSMNDIMTIFSDAADSAAAGFTSAINGPGCTPPFSPGIKPDQPLSLFNGQNRAGWWKLKCVDQAGADIGYVNGWGINLYKQQTLNLSALIQGFYNSSANSMIEDTLQVFLRIPLSPYPIVDTSKAILDSNGNANFNFTNAENGINYYLVLRHRNSIETWSASGIPFNSDTASYNFTTSSSQAFGNNQIQVDTSPVRFAIYNGDVNQDESVDLTDIVSVFNDASVFISGYIPTDVNGDNTVDLSDIVLTFNNSSNFVSVIKP